MEGAEANKINPAKAEEIFNLMAKFAEYGFNKSHSAAYAIVAYQTAYLKAHYPVEFMAALMSSEKDNQEKVVRLISECREAGLSVLPPDVNDSGYKFTVAEGAIRFGLGAVKGVGAAAIDSIIEARREGPFENLYNFCERVDTQKVNRRVIDSLIKCGAFDKSGGADRAVMAAAVDDALEAGARAQRDRKDGQSSMFNMLGGPGSTELNWPKIEPWRENVRLAFERESLGFFITGHPLAQYAAELNVISSATATEAKGKPDKAEVRVGGVVEKVQTKLDKKGKTFAYLTIEDLTGSVEVLVWSDTYAKCAEFLKPEQVIVVQGQVDAGEKGGQANAKIIAKDIMTLTEAVEQKTSTISFKLPRARMPEMLPFFENTLQNYPGSATAYIHLADADGVAVYRLDKSLKPCRELIEATRRDLGPSSLELR
jgi:DNA polymerase-3 subunit alpha